MAFDATNFEKPAVEVDEVGAIILKARERLSDPTRWCQGQIESANGSACIVGALVRSVSVAPGGSGDTAPYFSALRRIKDALPGRRMKSRSIIIFNDAKSTTHAMVLDLLDRAATNSTAQGD